MGELLGGGGCQPWVAQLVLARSNVVRLKEKEWSGNRIRNGEDAPFHLLGLRRLFLKGLLGTVHQGQGAGEARRARELQKGLQRS